MGKRFTLGLTVLFMVIFSLNSYAVEWEKGGEGWRLLDNKGRYARDQWFYDGGKQYYLNGEGYMSVGWTLIGDNLYYFESDGTLVTDQWVGNRYVDYSGKVTAENAGEDNASAGTSDVSNEGSRNDTTASQGSGNSSVDHYVPARPIEIKYMRAHMSKDGWISPNIYFINSSGKTISSMTFTMTPYNAAHDIVFCDVTGCSTTERVVMGPFNPDNANVCGKYILSSDGTVIQADPNIVEDYAKTFDNCVALDKIWHGGNISTYAIVGIKIQYLDGTWETVNPYDVIKQNY